MTFREFIMATVRVAFGMDPGTGIESGGIAGVILAWMLIGLVVFVVSSLVLGAVDGIRDGIKGANR